LNYTRESVYLLTTFKERRAFKPALEKQLLSSFCRGSRKVSPRFTPAFQ